MEEIEAAAIKKVIACMIAQTMAEAHITKIHMARRMDISRTQLDSLFNPNCYSMTLGTLTKAAAVGKRISISLEDSDTQLTI